MRKVALILFSIILIFPIAASGKTEDSGKGINVDSLGRAAFGHDVVAYFSIKKDAEAVEGSDSFAYSWKGAVWLFSSQKNLDAFKADPEMYRPQYGGYCAYAMSQDKVLYSDPNAWTLYNDRLYLFYQKRGRTKWRKDRDHYVGLANGYWPAQLARLESLK